MMVENSREAPAELESPCCSGTAGAHPPSLPRSLAPCGTGLSMLQVLEVPAFLIEAFPRTRRRFKHCRLTQDGSYEAKQWRSCGLRHEGRRVIHFPGGGKLFFWQSGVTAYLHEAGLMRDAVLAGTSAGALTVTLAACQVDAKHAVRVAIRLLKEAGVWDRPMGLIGVWGGIVRSWLDEILPDDAAERCSGRVHISILQLMPPERKHVSWFCSKADLIEACLASSHLPWVMDGRACFHFRGSPCVDGSILASRSATALPEHLQQGELHTIDYLHDGALRTAAIDFMALVEPEALYTLIDLGYDYGRRRFGEEGAGGGVTTGQ